LDFYFDSKLVVLQRESQSLSFFFLGLVFFLWNYMYCEFDFVNEAGKSHALIFFLDGLLFHDYKIGVELCYIIKKYNFSIYSTEAIIKCTLIFE